MEKVDWHSLDTKEIFHLLQSSESGISLSEAKERLKKFGLNLLKTTSSDSIPKIILRQINNPIVYLLIGSTIMAIALGKYIDATVIFSVVVLNTLIGFIQEYRANKMIRLLGEMLPNKTTVLRDGKKTTIHSAEIVPGDVIVLEAGDKIAADMRLFFVKNLKCDESILTGESFPVNKNTELTEQNTPIAERVCMAFNGTHVTAGTGLGVAVSTGMNTEFGKISELIEQVHPLETPLNATLRKIAYLITLNVIVVSTLLFFIGFLRGYRFFDSALSAVALAVAAIPEGLPAIITIASAIGVRRLAHRQVIIRQLPAVESLGSTTVICTDKTGTLTRNEMTVQQLSTHSGFSFVTGVGFSLEGEIIFPENKNPEILDEVERLLLIAALCNDAKLEYKNQDWAPIGDPTEVALIIAARKKGISEEYLHKTWKREDEIPFESVKRVMITLNHSISGQQFLFIKGAPEEIMKLCQGQDNHKVLQNVEKMAQEGMRVIACAQKQLDNTVHVIRQQDIKDGFTLIGLIGMIDPLRKEVHEALKSCHEAGIVVKMITGDHPITAFAIGKELGLINEKVITGTELDQLDQHDWKNMVKQHHVFARVSPENKLQLVEVLQESGEIVAMTGDGVNDAPALKKADIGIAMGIKGTAVAKEASDMVLADDNFASIKAAVEEGRKVYDNLIKSLAFVLPTSLAQALVICFAVLFFPLKNNMLLQPIAPVQILWINLIVAVGLALTLAFEKDEPDIMKRRPRKKNKPIFSRFIVVRTLSVGFLMAIATIILFVWKYNRDVSKAIPHGIALADAQTMTVTAIVFFQIFYLINCRSLDHSIKRIGWFSNPILLVGILAVLLAQLAFAYLPFMNYLFHSAALSIHEWLICIALSFLIFPLIWIEKYIKKIKT